MTMKWNLVGCFFIVFFLCFVFLCSLFFLALLNAVRCCYLLVILVLLLLFRLLHTFASSSVYRTKVAFSGLFYCGLPWSLSLSFFIEIWLIWQALVVNVDLALCARCTFIDFLFIRGIFFYQSFCRAMCKMIKERRGKKEVLQSSQQFLLSLDFLLFLFLFFLLVSVAFVQFRRLSQKNADKLTNICTFFFRIGIIFLLLLVCVFFVDGIEHCLQVSSPFFYKKYTIYYKWCACVLVLCAFCALIISRTNIT